jgi:uncharacterized protein (TIGR02145 family)
MCIPAALAAQMTNGVTVSTPEVSIGTPTTVTFNVSWDKGAGMPTLWVDSVWVFVDYNNNGVMKRLPLLPGATLTGTSADGVGKVIQEEGDTLGVWVAGNAKTAGSGSFSATVQLLTAAADFSGACAYASNYPPVGEYTRTNVIRLTGTAPYTVVLEHIDGTVSTYTAYGSFLVPGSYTVQSFTDKTGAQGIISAPYQGGCAYTVPALAGTFASFDPGSVGAATYVSLKDERDNKAYPVVKIGGRWVMAQNLNYQKDLTWQANSNSPSTATNRPVTELIGNFWCPGGNSGNSSATSTRASCVVWGALYSWETAMMVDGKWSDDDRNSSTWTQPATSNNSAFGNTNNGGRGANNHGICPPSWHVPTDAEWGELLNAMESTSASLTHNTDSGIRGLDAGTRGKSKCMCASGNCATDENVSWYYYSTASAQGTDDYGFRVLPSGYRTDSGSNFGNRGSHAFFWSSSASTGADAWYRIFYYDDARVARYSVGYSFGYSVRCIRDND